MTTALLLFVGLMIVVLAVEDRIHRAVDRQAARSAPETVGKGPLWGAISGGWIVIGLLAALGSVAYILSRPDVPDPGVVNPATMKPTLNGALMLIGGLLLATLAGGEIGGALSMIGKDNRQDDPPGFGERWSSGCMAVVLLGMAVVGCWLITRVMEWVG